MLRSEKCASHPFRHKYFLMQVDLRYTSLHAYMEVSLIEHSGI